MPQPLSKLVRGAIGIRWDIDVASYQPELAVLVARIMSLSSKADYSLGMGLIKMLGPKAAPAFAIYEALTWGYAKTKAMQSSAKMVLSAEDYKLFCALLRMYAEDENQRNKFAHWVWVYCNEASEYLVLLSPSAALRWQLTMSEGRYGTPLNIDPADFGNWVKRCECYSKAELRRIVDTFQETFMLTNSFATLCDPFGASKDEIRHTLATQPRLATALRHLEKQTQTPSSEHPSQPE